MRSLQRQNLESWPLFRSFYIRRAFRIYPLAITCVLLAYLGNGIWSNFLHEQWNRFDFLTNLTLTQDLFLRNNVVGGLWSLPLEVQMYVALPILFVLFRDKPASWLLIVWTASLPYAFYQPVVTARLDILHFIPCFLAGVVSWRLNVSRQLSSWLWPFGLAFASSIWFLSKHGTDGPYRWACCLAVGLAIPMFRNIQSPGFNTVSKWIAKYSYGIYLSHIWIFELAFVGLRGHSWLVRWGVTAILAPTIPMLFYHLIEEPMIQAGKHLAVAKTVRFVLPRFHPAISHGSSTGT